MYITLILVYILHSFVLLNVLTSHKERRHHVLLILLHLHLTLFNPTDYLWCYWKYCLIRPEWQTSIHYDWPLVLVVLNGAATNKRRELLPSLSVFG